MRNADPRVVPNNVKIGKFFTSSFIKGLIVMSLGETHPCPHTCCPARLKVKGIIIHPPKQYIYHLYMFMTSDNWCLGAPDLYQPCKENNEDQ